MMLELVLLILFCWLFFKAIGLAVRMAWGAAKIVASILLAIACPLLVLGLIFAGGFALMIPVAMIAVAFGLLKACV